VFRWIRRLAEHQPTASATRGQPTVSSAPPLGDAASMSSQVGPDVRTLRTSGDPVTASLDEEEMDQEEEPDQRESFVNLFHLVNSLVPDEQNVLVVRPGTSVREALDVMRANGFSQLPVMEGGLVLGVFSYRSFANRAIILGKIDLGRAEVDDFIEDLEFVRVTDELGRTFQYLDRDGAALVVDPDQLIAVATPTDLIDYLYGLTHPFMLIQEIELVLRRLVSATVSEGDLPQYIRRAVSSNYRDREEQIPTELGKLSFAELVQTVVHSANFSEAFHRILGNNRESAWGYLGRISSIRNDVFHFRGPITDDDVQVLIDARTWLLRKARAAEARGDAR
jgi:hypothetical protein